MPARVVPINPEIEQAYRDWMGRRAFWQSTGWRRGYFRVRPGDLQSAPAPWNKAVKRWFGPQAEGFHEAATAWYEANTPPAPQHVVVTPLGRGMFKIEAR